MKLPKSARIHHRSLQERLFNEGSKLHEFPLRLTWNSLSDEELRKNFRDRIPSLIGPVQVLVSVPKKKRRKAVDRALMRRRIREAFRLNRAPLVQTVCQLEGVRTLSVGFVFMKEANVTFGEIEEKMRKLLDRLEEKIKEKYTGGDKADDEESTVEATDSSD